MQFSVAVISYPKKILVNSWQTKREMKHALLILLILISPNAFAERKYQKTHYKNETIKVEGWLDNNKKIAYWEFYYKNGTIEKEGHFLNNKPINYWYFYTVNGVKKTEGHLVNGQKTNWW